MSITYHDAFDQGSEQWHQARLGLLTASEMHLIVTPGLKVAANDKTRAHEWELLAQRITGHVEPQHMNDNFIRGHEDEIKARNLYSATYAPVKKSGFVTNDKWGFTIGYSPDGLIGDDGLLECKSRRQRFQVEVLMTGEVPTEHVIQCQTGLLVTERKWLDYVSYSGGLPMPAIRVFPCPETQAAIIAAATAFEQRVAEKLARYAATIDTLRTVPTERTAEMEMV
jgi:YqaJ-like viral recombinase domain